MKEGEKIEESYVQFRAIISMGRMVGGKFKEDNRMTGKYLHGKRRKNAG